MNSGASINAADVLGDLLSPTTPSTSGSAGRLSKGPLAAYFAVSEQDNKTVVCEVAKGNGNKCGVTLKVQKSTNFNLKRHLKVMNRPSTLSSKIHV